MGLTTAARTAQGTKYHQAITEATPSDGTVDAQGFRTEDSVRVNSDADGTLRIAVADGHGSLEAVRGRYVGGPEAASAATTSALALTNPFADPVRAFERLDDAVRIATEQSLASPSASSVPSSVQIGRSKDGVFHMLRADRAPETLMHGTTLLLVEMSPRQASVQSAHVGDTMLLLVRGDAHEFVGRPHDASSRTERVRMFRADARRRRKYFAMSVRGEEYSTQITRALGHFGNQAILSEPEVHRFALQPGDRFVAATDGVWSYAKARTVASIVRHATDADDAAATLAHHIDEATAARRKRDNMAFAVVFCDGLEVRTRRRSWYQRLFSHRLRPSRTHSSDARAQK